MSAQVTRSIPLHAKLDSRHRKHHARCLPLPVRGVHSGSTAVGDCDKIAKNLGAAEAAPRRPRDSAAACAPSKRKLPLPLAASVASMYLPTARCRGVLERRAPARNAMERGWTLALNSLAIKADEVRGTHSPLCNRNSGSRRRRSCRWAQVQTQTVPAVYLHYGGPKSIGLPPASYYRMTYAAQRASHGLCCPRQIGPDPRPQHLRRTLPRSGRQCTVSRG